MGITGLLPALKSIQEIKHISEFAGQTIAVDAYVWLHRGVLGCATELATGKPTHKYVNYAMGHIRLLRFHGIEPYVVFDGGPLPAKRGTEVDRKQRREENLKKGNALAAQGRHTQARECYVKCVDVTPQMAFQFIKALRQESVSYIVAPYEADAQLAYLERIGIVDGIITEDSDLLVFGCRNVLFKFDANNRTVVNIKRDRFGSVSGSASESNGISLVGWSDKQFRAMAILSGCDYLPSIPGIGLKTACSLLRKWKTVEQVIRTIALEGKKLVPRGYLNQVLLAEKCFLHQRVYCPKQEKLVYLSDVDETWNPEAEAYVGGDLEPSLAKKIALGDVDPITLLPMHDINPDFTPRSLKRPAPVSLDSTRKDKGKGKEKATPTKDGILSFFGPNPAIPPQKGRHIHILSPLRPKKPLVGKASGKRTLADVMDQDLVATRKQRSKFFASPKPKVLPSSRQTDNSHPLRTAGPSRLSENKENLYIVIDDDDEELGSGVSIAAQGEVNSDMMQEVEELPAFNVVEQEDGYISPTPSCSGELQDLSSPIRPGHTPVAKRQEADHDFGADAVSSPPSQAKKRFHLTTRVPNRTRSLDPSPSRTPTRHRNIRTLPKAEKGKPIVVSSSFSGLDLRHSFGDDDIDCSDEDTKVISQSASSPTPTPSPATPITQQNTQIDALDVDVPSDPEEENIRANEIRKQAVIDGWRNQWALNKNKLGAPPTSGCAQLVRRETNVTPAGRHSLGHIQSRFRPYPFVTPQFAPAKNISRKNVKMWRAQGRKSLPFFEAVRSPSPSAVDPPDLESAEYDVAADQAHFHK